MSAIVCATGVVPYSESAASGGYFGIVQKIMNEPSPALTLAQGFSPEFCDWIAKCLIKDPEQRWTAAQLLEHPFLRAADAHLNPQEWPPKFSADRVKANEADMDAVLRALAAHYYLRPGSPAYKGSLFEMARFDRVAQQFGVADMRQVKKRFEVLLKEVQAGGADAVAAALAVLNLKS